MDKQVRNIEHRKLQAIGSNYNYAVKRIDEIRHYHRITKSQAEIRDYYINYVEHIYKCYVLFNSLERSILEKEYFTPLPKGWWVTIYPKSTYYRLRLNIARRFLDYMVSV